MPSLSQSLNSMNVDDDLSLLQVADVNRKIETDQGPDVYPAARQMLYHKGKELDDDSTTMEVNEVSENSTIIIMKSRSRSSSAPPSTPVAAPPPSQASSSTIYCPTPSYPPKDYSQIIERSSASPHPPVAAPPRQNDSPTLYKLRLPFTVVPPPPAVPPPSPSPPNQPNTNPLDLFPQFNPRVIPNFNVLRRLPVFQSIRSLVRANPTILQPVQVESRRLNAQGYILHEYEEECLRMIFEPDDGRDESRPSVPLNLAPDDMAAIARLEALGFDRALAIGIYFFLVGMKRRPPFTW
ncbi:hypothetical protein LXL04_011242 [Taraxacum kok-saghyz]